jgi:hypothetical protein
LSILSPKTPYGFTTFFDDLRQEANGKYIFSGVYTGNMVLPMVPVVLPMFSVMITYREAPGESSEPVTLKIFVPGRDEPMLAVPLPVEQMREVQYEQSYLDVEGLDKILSLQAPYIFSPFMISGEGFIKIRAYRGEDEIRLGTLRVQLATPQPPTST